MVCGSRFSGGVVRASFGIGSTSEMASFYLSKVPTHVSGSVHQQRNVEETSALKVDLRTLTDTLALLNHHHLDVLKLDIEVSEFEVAESILTSGATIDQIVIEIHDRFFDNGLARSRELVQLMKRYGYRIFARSETYQELSFAKV